jgi:hypothetical protein
MASFNSGVKEKLPHRGIFILTYADGCKQLRKRRNYPCRTNKGRGAGNVLEAGAGNKWQFENPPQHQGDIIMVHICHNHWFNYLGGCQIISNNT